MPLNAPERVFNTVASQQVVDITPLDMLSKEHFMNGDKMAPPGVFSRGVFSGLRDCNVLEQCKGDQGEAVDEQG